MGEKTEPLDRNFIRKLLKYTQMDYPTRQQVLLLGACIDKRLEEFGGMGGTYRVARICGKFIKVESDYFESREGVSFNDDGFVGFCGWADNTNLQPILWGVIDWVNEITGYDATHKTLQDMEIFAPLLETEKEMVE